MAAEKTVPVTRAAGVTATMGHKRSFRQAQHRCKQDPLGSTRYQGKRIHGSHHTAFQTPPTVAHKPRRPACRSRGGANQRLRVLSINVNSLSGFRWGEMKAFLGGEGLPYDFIFLQETHRTSISAFQVDHNGWQWEQPL